MLAGFESTYITLQTWPLVLCSTEMCVSTSGASQGHARLQGKYLDGGPSQARLNKYRGRYAEAESRYGSKANTVPAIRRYVALAQEAGMSPAELAIRYSSAQKSRLQSLQCCAGASLPPEHQKTALILCTTHGMSCPNLKRDP